MIKDRDEVIHKLIDISMTGTIWTLSGELFRVGGMFWIYIRHTPMGWPTGWNFLGIEVDRISEIDTLTDETKAQLGHVAIFPRIPLCGAEGR